MSFNETGTRGTEEPVQQVIEAVTSLAMPEAKEEPLFISEPGIPRAITPAQANDLRKKGFYTAIDTADPSSNKLQDLLNHRDLLTHENLQGIDKHFNDCFAVIHGRIEYWKLKLVQKKLIRQEYESELKKMESGREHLLQSLDQLREQLTQTKQALGAAKEQLILKRIEEVEKETQNLVSAFQSAENTLNQKFAADYNANNQRINERLNFLRNKFNEWQTLYETAKSKLASLQAFGVAPKQGNMYVSLGWTGAIIAGWLFSIWAGTDAKMADNNSLRFFLIDSFARFSLYYSPLQLLGGLLAFIVIISVISWLCYVALKQLRPSSAGKSGKKQPYNYDSNYDENLFINFNAQDQLITSRFRSGTWLGLWLKMAPYITFVFLTIAILAKYSFAGAMAGSDPFKNLFNSLVNQSFGTLLAVAFSGLMTLYISRVIENRTTNKNKNWELSAALIVFGFMMLAMVIYHMQLPFLTDIRTIAMLGFIACCFAAGMLLGYGHRYNFLYRLKNTMEENLDDLNAYISYLSSPFKANYLNYRELQNSLRIMVVDLSEIIANRSSLTADLVTGSSKRASYRSSIPRSGIASGGRDKTWLSRFVYWVKHKWRHSASTETSGHVYSIDEQYYFPHLSAIVDGILQQSANINLQLAEIDKHLNGYWRNEYTYKSINDQVIYVERTIGNHTKDLSDLTNQHNKARFEAYQTREKEKILITEGFFTGLWYLQNQLVINNQIN
jgi:hypothetical protein